MTKCELHLPAEKVGIRPIKKIFDYMKRACQILTHKGMTNGEHHVSPIKIKNFDT